MSTLTQFFGGGGVPIGSMVDIPDQAPNVYEAGGQTFLRSGVSALGSTYPQVPASIRGQIYNAEIKQNLQKYPLPYIGSLTTWNNSGRLQSNPPSFKMAANGTTIIGFPVGWNAAADNTRCQIFCRSTDSGATYEYIASPWVNDTIASDEYPAALYGCAGLFYFNSAFVCVTRNGNIYRSINNGSTWTLIANISYGGRVGNVEVVNNRMFILPGQDGPFNQNGTAYASVGLSRYADSPRALQGTASQLLYWQSDSITWSIVDVGESQRWTDIAHNGSVYIITCGAQVIRRCVTAGDPTSTWVLPTTPPPALFQGFLPPTVQVCTTFGTVLIAANPGLNSYGQSMTYYTATLYNRALWYSTDNGVTWVGVGLSNNTSETGTGAYISAPQSSFLFDGTTLWFRCGKTYKTTNGTTWTEHTSTGQVDYTTSIQGDLVNVGGTWHGINWGIPQSGGGNGPLINFYNYTTANIFTTATIVDQVADGLTVETVLWKNQNTVLLFPGIPDAQAGAVLLSGLRSQAQAGNLNRFATDYNGTSFLNGFGSSHYGFGMFRKYLYTTDGGANWQYGFMPYMASWSCPGLGQNGDVYATANGSNAQSQFINYPTLQTMTDDRRIYRTSNLSSWTRVADLQASTQALKFFADKNQTSSNIMVFDFAFGGFRFFNQKDSGATWTSVYTLATGQGAGGTIGYQAQLRIVKEFYAPSGGTYIAFSCPVGFGGGSTGYSSDNTSIIFSPTDFSNGTIGQIPLSQTALNTRFTDGVNYQFNMLFGACFTNTGKLVLTFGQAEYRVVGSIQQPITGAYQVAMQQDLGTNWVVRSLSAYDSTYQITGKTYTSPIFCSYDSSTGKLFIRYDDKLLTSGDDGTTFGLTKTSRTAKAIVSSNLGYAYNTANNGAPGDHGFNRDGISTGIHTRDDKIYTTYNGNFIGGLNGDYIKNGNYVSPQAGVVKYMRVA